MSAATALLAVQPLLAPLVRAAEDEFDPNDVTPGVWGFVITFGVMVIVVLLALDMTRRIRRTNYRAEVQEELAREMAESDAAAGGAGAEAQADAAASDDSAGADDADDAASGDGPKR